MKSPAEIADLRFLRALPDAHGVPLAHGVHPQRVRVAHGPEVVRKVSRKVGEQRSTVSGLTQSNFITFFINISCSALLVFH